MRTIGAGLMLVLGVASAMGQAAPAWQTAAGGKMAFDVASIRPSASGEYVAPNFPFTADNAYAPTGGMMAAEFPLVVYIQFAYKLWLTRPQTRALIDQLPKEIASQSFTIRARASGNPTKDQMRLMMQALLADRFKLAVHFETKQSPVLALKPIKPGSTGPRLRPHSEGPACDGATSGTAMFAPTCNEFAGGPQPYGMFRIGARNIALDLMAASLSIARIGPQIVDQTGLSGNYDFQIEFMPEAGGPTQTNGFTPGKGDTSGEPQGPTFLQALKEQLGLKLESSTALLSVLIVDHVEMPSEN
jgi:uncharacterized protein (TIGR03435 family)